MQRSASQSARLPTNICYPAAVKGGSRVSDSGSAVLLSGESAVRHRLRGATRKIICLVRPSISPGGLERFGIVVEQRFVSFGSEQFLDHLIFSGKLKSRLRTKSLKALQERSCIFSGLRAKYTHASI